MSRIARLLNTSADVYREQRTPDGMGGFTHAWVQTSTVRARISQPSSSALTEAMLGGQSGESLTHVFYLEPTADVRRGDELRRGTDVFVALAVYQPSEPDTYKRVDSLYRQAGQ